MYFVTSLTEQISVHNNLPDRRTMADHLGSSSTLSNRIVRSQKV